MRNVSNNLFFFFVFALLLLSLFVGSLRQLKIVGLMGSKRQCYFFLLLIVTLLQKLLQMSLNCSCKYIMIEGQYVSY